MQVRPFPVNPSLQVQLNEPAVLMQFAFALQLSVRLEHSLISAEQVVTSIQLGKLKKILWKFVYRLDLFEFLLQIMYILRVQETFPHC